MKRRTKNVFLIAAVLCLNAVFAFNNFNISSAQRTPNVRPSQTPTPLPATPTAATPQISPTPEVEETISVTTELVNLNVRVVDRNNRSITNLSQNDFKVFEDNIPQPIEFFSKSEVPTNYSLLIDNSGSLRFQLEKVIEAGKTIIETNRPDDETSIIRFVSSDKIEIQQDFTPSKTDLFDSLDNLYIEGGQTAIIDAVYLAAEKVNRL